MNNPIHWTEQRRRLSDLTPWPRNPRQIKTPQAKRLLESVEEFGQVETLAVGPDGEVYNGHQRLNVLMQKYGPDYEVDVRVSSRPLDEKEREKLTVYLHRGATGEWNFDLLANEFDAGELIEWGFDAAELGIDLTGGDDNDAAPQIDRAEELREQWGVEPGQLWRLPSRSPGQEHRLICGDCTDAAVVERVMGGERAGAVVTDPPYGINQAGITNDNPEGLRSLFDGCLVAAPIKDAVVIAFQSPRLEWVWLDALRGAGHKPERLLWLYRTGQSSYPWRGWYMRSDVIRVSSVGKPIWADYPEAATDCYTVNINDTESIKATAVGGNSLHTTVKPVDIVANLIEHTTGIVYDPFLGSGTTIIAAENLSRQCRAVEIAPGYVAVALQRYCDAFGIEPELVG